MERYTIERQKASLRTRQATRALRGLLDDIDSEYTIYTMEAIAEGLAFARQRDCHCGEPATEMVARPRNGATDVVSAVSGLLDGRIAPEQASMLDTLLRRVGLLMEAGIEDEESFDRKEV